MKKIIFLFLSVLLLAPRQPLFAVRKTFLPSLPEEASLRRLRIYPPTCEDIRQGEFTATEIGATIRCQKKYPVLQEKDSFFSVEVRGCFSKQELEKILPSDWKDPLILRVHFTPKMDKIEYTTNLEIEPIHTERDLKPRSFLLTMSLCFESRYRPKVFKHKKTGQQVCTLQEFSSP